MVLNNIMKKMYTPVTELLRVRMRNLFGTSAEICKANKNNKKLLEVKKFFSLSVRLLNVIFLL